jgi:hypothetical protein
MTKRGDRKGRPYIRRDSRCAARAVIAAYAVFSMFQKNCTGDGIMPFTLVR